MRRPTTFLLAVALLLGVTGRGGVDAQDREGCEGSWTRAASCTFNFETLPIIVNGHTNLAGGTVRVWLTLSGWPEVVLFSCAPRPDGTCEDEIRAEGYGEERIPRTIPRVSLTCNVAGAGSGRYSCASGPRLSPSG